MQYSVAVLGTGIVHRLQARSTAPLVIIGRDKFTRLDLALVESFNYIAAQTLTQAIKRLDVENTRDLFLHVEPEQLALPRIGAIALSVLGACFEIKKVGTLDDWVARTRQKGERVTTFLTMKEHISKTTTRSTRKQRKEPAA